MTTRRGPRNDLAIRALEDAERYRIALIAAHKHIKTLEATIEELRHHAEYLKKKRKEAVQEASNAKRRFAKQSADPTADRQALQFLAGRLTVALPAPGSDMAVVLRAYRLLRKENEELRERLSRR